MEKTLLRFADVSIKLDMPKWKKPPEGKYRIINPIASKLSPNSLLLIKCSAFWNDIMQSGAFKKKKKYVLNFYNFFSLYSPLTYCMKKALAICFPFRFFFLYVVIFFFFAFSARFLPRWWHRVR